ncbi:MAG TPA: hypothetical protein VMM13_16670, partial [Euzebya sp.]|nr:hypothetical protein [Euzebya sp.]
MAATAHGRPQEAGRALTGALRELDRLPDGDADCTRLRIRVLMAQASCDFERSGLPAALSTLDGGAQLAEQLADGELVALCHSQRAMLYGRSGMMAAALPELDAAVGDLRLLTPRDRWVLLLNRGILHSHRGAFAEAAADLTQAEREAATAGLVRERALALHDRGYVAYLTGDLPLALDLMGAAGRREADLPPEVRLDHGRVLLEAGLIHEAVETLTAAAGECTNRRQLQVLGEIHLDLARAHGLLGDVERGLALARSARDRFRRRGATVWAARCEVVGLGLALARGTR